ncbi:hypothetical protein F5878DRAFT_655241 [Lentinula raphanica]|uniref:Uncharacterized protein n=1 Tax=Lentinula raphanica TaxID=153919 RepID=A0AA38PLF4_9AGAR|nr:hypothetical protein F5878DRAFT_655241 [Lentinula raphanica]
MLRLDGFRVLRSKKEYSLFSRGPDIVLLGLNAVQLLTFGLKLQEDAYLLDDADEIVPPAARIPPPSLSNLFADAPLLLSLGELSNGPLPKRAKTTSHLSPTAPSQASGKSRQKAQYRAKRCDARSAQQMALGSVVKAVARRRADEAQIEVCAAAANVFSRGAWSASRITRLPPPQIVASKDVFDLSGLQLIEWDGSTHSNIPIAAHEHRSSIAFFMSSGLGWWYQNDYM